MDDDLGFGGPAYDRSSNSLDAPLWDLSESPGAQLVISSQGSWEVSAVVGGQFVGTYAISPAIAAVPEPSTFALLVAGVGLLGFMILGKTHFARAIKDSATSDRAPDDPDGMPFIGLSLGLTAGRRQGLQSPTQSGKRQHLLMASPLYSKADEPVR